MCCSYNLRSFKSLSLNSFSCLRYRVAASLRLSCFTSKSLLILLYSRSTISLLVYFSSSKSLKYSFSSNMRCSAYASLLESSDSLCFSLSLSTFSLTESSFAFFSSSSCFSCSFDNCSRLACSDSLCCSCCSSVLNNSK